MNKIKVFILVFIFGFISCKKMNSVGTEKLIAERIAKHIIEKDSLKNYTYSGEASFHIKSRKINNVTYKTYVSFNSLKSKSTELKTEKVNIDGFQTIIYYSELNNEFNLPGPFWVPDSRGWNFLTELIEDEIILYKLKQEMSTDINEIEELNEINF